MSSTYDLICVNHDPAILLGYELNQCAQAVKAARGEFQHMPDELPGTHGTCDLLVGRHSGALVEIACPGGLRCHYHHEPQWVATSWLRLLYMAYKRNDPIEHYRIPMCWTPKRVLRLYAVLYMDPITFAVSL